MLKLFFLFSICSCLCINAQPVLIGNQTWDSKNLNVTKFRNGDEIPQAKSIEEMKAYQIAEEPAWCYYNFDPKLGKIYGILYNGYAVRDSRGIAPEGWRIPNDTDFVQLVKRLGGEEKARVKLKSKNGWNENNGTNSSGFNGLPGGVVYGQTFLRIGKETNFWSCILEVNKIDDENGFINVLSLMDDENLNFSGDKLSKEEEMIKGHWISNYSYVRCIK